MSGGGRDDSMQQTRLSPRAGLAGTRRSWLAGLLLFAGACSNNSRREVSYDYGEPKNRYRIHGEILRLRPENRLAVIKHEKIEGWMEAMTMEFPVKDPREFEALHSGDRITATVFVRELDYWIGDIRK